MHTLAQLSGTVLLLCVCALALCVILDKEAPPVPKWVPLAFGILIVLLFFILLLISLIWLL